MDFMALPPEITSALIHSGPGAESLIAASSAWQRLGTGLEETASSYGSVVHSLTGAWQGSSSAAMTQAVAPFLTWLRTTAQQCQQLGSSAQAAAVAFNSALSAVVPPAEVSANRAQLARLVATDRLGSNLTAIAENEAQYQNMWVNNSAAMNTYQAASTQALDVSQFSSPPSTANPTAAAAQASAASATATGSSVASTLATTAQSLASPLDDLVGNGWFQLVNTYANQFISSGFPINMLSYLAQNTSAQALQTVGGDIGQGLSEGESALGSGGLGSLGALGAAGLQEAAPTAAIGVGVTMGKLTVPPAVVGLLPASQAPVQLASAASPLPAGDAGGLPMLPPLMPPPISAGSGWRKRKQQKYEDLEYGAELKGTVMPRNPSAG